MPLLVEWFLISCQFKELQLTYIVIIEFPDNLMDLQSAGNLWGILDVIWFFENITFRQI